MEWLFTFIAGHASELWEKREQFLALLRSFRSRTFALPICVFLLVSAVGQIYWYKRRSDNYEAVVTKALTARSNMQSDPALQNLLLSSIQNDAAIDLKDERLDSDFQEAWKQLVDAASETNTTETASLFLVPGSSGGQILTEPEPDNNHTQFAVKPGFLFVPSFLFLPPLSREKEQKVFDEGQWLSVTQDQTAKQNRPAVLSKDKATELKPQSCPSVSPDNDPKSSTPICVESSLYSHISLTRNVSIGMQKIASMAMVSANGQAGKYLSALPVQSYIVLSSGIIRVFVHDEPPSNKVLRESVSSDYLLSKPSIFLANFL